MMVVCEYCDCYLDADADPECVVATIRGKALVEEIICPGCRSPSRRMDAAIDQIIHDLITIEDALKLGVPLGERRNTLNAFITKLNRILARQP